MTALGRETLPLTEPLHRRDRPHRRRRAGSVRVRRLGPFSAPTLGILLLITFAIALVVAMNVDGGIKLDQDKAIAGSIAVVGIGIMAAVAGTISIHQSRSQSILRARVEHRLARLRADLQQAQHEARSARIAALSNTIHRYLQLMRESADPADLARRVAPEIVEFMNIAPMLPTAADQAELATYIAKELLELRNSQPVTEPQGSTGEAAVRSVATRIEDMFDPVTGEPTDEHEDSIEALILSTASSAVAP